MTKITRELHFGDLNLRPHRRLFSGLDENYFRLKDRSEAALRSNRLKERYKNASKLDLYMSLSAYEARPTLSIFEDLESNFNVVYKIEIQEEPDSAVLACCRAIVQHIRNYYDRLSMSQIHAKHIYLEAIENFSGVVILRNLEAEWTKDPNPPSLEVSDQALFRRLYRAAMPLAYSNTGFDEFISLVHELQADYNKMFHKIYSIPRMNKHLESKIQVHERNMLALQNSLHELEVNLMLNKESH